MAGEPLYFDSASGAHAHMTDAGEKICRDTLNCETWIAYDEEQDQIAEQEAAWDDYQERRMEEHESYLDSLYYGEGFDLPSYAD